MTTLIIFTFLFFSIKVNASPSFSAKKDTLSTKKRATLTRKSRFIAFKTLSSSAVFPNQLETKTNANSKSLSLKADFWFAFFAIGSLASTWLIKPRKYTTG